MAYKRESHSVEQSEDRRAIADSAQKRDLLAEMASIGANPPARNADAVVYLSGAALPSHPLGGRAKRTFDVIGVSTIALLALPLLVAILIATKLLNRGPVLFGHKRVGFRGREFKCLKFRTMVVDADKKLTEYLAANLEAAKEWEQSQKLRHDPRVTRFGAFLRKTSLDELPQLLNIFRGEMSLVGPRPVTAEELARYGARRTAYLSARPGMTGLWQISGRNATTYERRTELDEIYVTSWTMAGDVKIIARTVPEMLPSSRAY